jgi:hypothetical protein
MRLKKEMAFLVSSLFLLSANVITDQLGKLKSIISDSSFQYIFVIFALFVLFFNIVRIALNLFFKDGNHPKWETGIAASISALFTISIVVRYGKNITDFLNIIGISGSFVVGLIVSFIVLIITYFILVRTTEKEGLSKLIAGIVGIAIFIIFLFNTFNTSDFRLGNYAIDLITAGIFGFLVYITLKGFTKIGVSAMESMPDFQKHLSEKEKVKTERLLENSKDAIEKLKNFLNLAVVNGLGEDQLLNRFKEAEVVLNRDIGFLKKRKIQLLNRDFGDADNKLKAIIRILQKRIKNTDEETRKRRGWDLDTLKTLISSLDTILNTALNDIIGVEKAIEKSQSANKDNIKTYIKTVISGIDKRNLSATSAMLLKLRRMLSGQENNIQSVLDRVLDILKDKRKTDQAKKGEIKNLLMNIN